MSHSEEGSSSSSGKGEKRYKGVRRRKWGKWVSEIRVPGTRERLWLGSYSTPEAAAIAHDTALFSLRGLSVADHLNFPMCLPPFLRTDMSPRSIQKVASEAGMAIDAELKAKAKETNIKVIESEGTQGGLDSQVWEDEDDYSPGMNGESGSELKDEEAFSISIDDMEIYLS